MENSSVIRDRTHLFKQAKTNSRQKESQSRFALQKASLLNIDDSTEERSVVTPSPKNNDVMSPGRKNFLYKQMASLKHQLPPLWVDISEEIDESLQTIDM